MRDAAKTWYERLLGVEPTVSPHATEAAWKLAEHLPVRVENRAAPGGATTAIFVDDRARDRGDRCSGIEPTERVTYSNGVRKAICRDEDGNEIGFGGGPSAAAPGGVP